MFVLATWSITRLLSALGSMWLSIAIAFMIYTPFISNWALSVHHNCLTTPRYDITSTRCPLNIVSHSINATGRHLQYSYCLTIGLTCHLTGEPTASCLICLSSKCAFQSLDTGELSPPFQFFCTALYQCKVFESSRACSFLGCIALLPSSPELSSQDVKQIYGSI